MGSLGLEWEADPCLALAEGEAIAALFAPVRPLLLAVSSRLRQMRSQAQLCPGERKSETPADVVACKSERWTLS